MEFETKSVVCAHPGGTHKMTYYEWNPCGSPTVVCVHGLTRTGRDFDLLAKALVAKGLRCVCPDIVGRGQSDWLPENAFANYSYPQFVFANCWSYGCSIVLALDTRRICLC